MRRIYAIHASNFRRLTAGAAVVAMSVAMAVLAGGPAHAQLRNSLTVDQASAATSGSRTTMNADVDFYPEGRYQSTTPAAASITMAGLPAFGQEGLVDAPISVTMTTTPPQYGYTYTRFHALSYCRDAQGVVTQGQAVGAGFPQSGSGYPAFSPSPTSFSVGCTPPNTQDRPYLGGFDHVMICAQLNGVWDCPTVWPAPPPIVDTDGDGLSDTWETEGINYDNDGAPELDLPAMGTDPNHKDLFIEIDWMVKDDTCIWFICFGGRNFAPQPDALADVVAAFAAAPVPNPDGSTGIRMHIDSGPQSIMDPRTGAIWGQRSRAGAGGYQETLGTFNGDDYNWTEFEGRKSSDFELFRRDVFHYVLYADRYGSDDNGSSGISRGIPGSDLLVTDGHEDWDGGFSRTQERGTYMHELGHGLSLRHGGGDDTNNKPDYESIMNYLFQLVGLPPDSRVDYSRGAPYVDWNNLRFDGGSIGDLGDANPQPTTTPVDSLDAETARQLEAFARPGDGIIDIVGPTVLLPNTGTQPIQLDVTNHGPTPETFTTKLTSNASALTGETSAPVPAGSTARLTIPINTAQLQPGEYDISATLSSPAGESLFTDTGGVTVPDTADPAVRQAANDALDQLNNLPADSGLDPVLKTQLSTMLTPVNDPPVAVDNTYTTAEDTALTVPLPGVLGNDTDPDNDPLTAAVVTAPAHGTVTLNPNGSFTYIPAVDYNGPDSFTYTANDGAATSNTATVTITVTAVNDAPTVTVTAGGSCGINDRSGTMNLALADVDNPATALTLGVASSNTPLLPTSNVTLTGTGATRTLSATTTLLRTGTALLTLTASDGQTSTTTPLTVQVGSFGNDTLTGTANADLLLSQTGFDTLSGLGGNDLLCAGVAGGDTLNGGDNDDTLIGGAAFDTLNGGPGNDRLTGGIGPDRFSGGPGTDTATDFNRLLGDTQDGTIP